MHFGQGNAVVYKFPSLSLHSSYIVRREIYQNNRVPSSDGIFCVGTCVRQRPPVPLSWAHTFVFPRGRPRSPHI